MSINDNTIRGKLNVAAGKVKQTVGEATNNNRIANEGVAQQVKGHAEQVWGSVKGAANDTAAKARVRADDSAADSKVRRENKTEHKTRDVRESIASTAQNVKNHIQDSVTDYRAKHLK